MAELSAQTLAEMKVGAETLAAKNGGGEALPPEYMEALKEIHERHAAIVAWERAGKVVVESTKRLSVKYEDRPSHDWHQLYHVLPGRDGPTFNDIPAERAGASPSELLVANIALALQAFGEL